MKTIRKIIIPSIITILLIAVVAWKLSSNKKVMEEKAAIAETKTVVFPVTVVHSKSQVLNQLIEVNGVFNPNHSLNFYQSNLDELFKFPFAKDKPFLKVSNLLKSMMSNC